MGFSCRKNAFFQAPIKLAQPFPAPELRTKHFTDTRIFLSEAQEITAFYTNSDKLSNLSLLSFIVIALLMQGESGALAKQPHDNPERSGLLTMEKKAAQPKMQFLQDVLLDVWWVLREQDQILQVLQGGDSKSVLVQAFMRLPVGRGGRQWLEVVRTSSATMSWLIEYSLRVPQSAQSRDIHKIFCTQIWGRQPPPCGQSQMWGNRGHSLDKSSKPPFSPYPCSGGLDFVAVSIKCLGPVGKMPKDFQGSWGRTSLSPKVLVHRIARSKLRS